MATEKTFADFGIETRGRRGGNLKTKCPKCQHTRRPEHRSDLPLSVDIDNGVWNCHNCGFKGTLKTIDWRDAQPVQHRYTRPEPIPDGTLGPRARAWLEGRSIDADLAAEFGVYSENNDSAIAFPYYRDGELVHIKYRSIDGKRFWSTPDSEPTFYGFDLCHDANDVLIVEGEADLLACLTAGIDTVLSVPNGAPNPGTDAGKKLACMDTAVPIFERARRVLIATDSDAPGNTLADELIRRIGPEKCFRVKWPTGTSDANEALENYGANGLADIISRAQPTPIQGLVYSHDVADLVWERRNDNHRLGLSTGWPEMDELFRVGRGQLTIFTGTPSSGKSAYIAALAVNIARLDDAWKFAFFTPEQFPPEEFFKALYELAAGKNICRMTREEFAEAQQWVDDHFIVQAPEEPTMEAIMELARICVLRDGITGMVIDPYTEVQSTRLPGMSEHETIGLNLTRIRKFGQIHGVHMIVAAHPTKPDKSAGDKPVNPYDISGSAHWFNKADNLFSIHRPDRVSKSAPVDVYLMKVRFRDYGHPGRISFGFDPECGRYHYLETSGIQQP